MFALTNHIQMTDKYNIYQYYDEIDLKADELIEREAMAKAIPEKPELKRENAMCFSCHEAVAEYCRECYEIGALKRAEDFVREVFQEN